MVRRFIGFITAAITVISLAALAYTYVQSSLSNVDDSEVTNDGRLLVTAVQPEIPKWTSAVVANGFDVSFPQCKKSLAQTTDGFVIVGLNHGKPLSQNPCFARQWKWAKKHQGAAIYINVADPQKMAPVDYGHKLAQDGLARLKKYGVPNATPIWLDIETSNSWAQPYRSVQVINTILDEFTKAGHPVGIYSAPAHWFEITLNAVIDVPIWAALGKYPDTQSGFAAAALACQQILFGDEQPALVQFVTKKRGSYLDHNLLCNSDPAGLVAAP